MTSSTDNKKIEPGAMHKNIVSRRNTSMDILKGIGIVLMVYGHTFAKGHDYIYLFHMAIFFMASGFLFSNKKINSAKDIQNIIVRKLKSLYVPYIVCNIIFLSLTNIFLKLNIYTSNPEFLKATEGNAVTQMLTEPLTSTFYIKSLIKILIGKDTTQLANPSWFLITLLVVTIFHAVLTYIIQKVHIVIRHILRGGIILGLVLLVSYLPVTGEIRRIAAACLVFQMGIILRVFWNEKYYNSFTVIVAAIILYFLSKMGTIELAGGRILSLPFFAIASLLGWVMIFTIGKYIENYLPILRDIFVYLGRNTLSILLLHLLCFKLINAFYVISQGLPKYMIASFHVIFGLQWYYSIIYTVVGIIVPVVFWNAFKRIEGKVKHYINNLEIKK